MYSAQSMTLFGVCLLVTALLVCGCMHWRKSRQRRKKEARKRKLVMETVQAAMTNCVLFDVHVENDKGVVTRMYRAQCVAVTLLTANLILEGAVRTSGWSGRKVHVYFRLSSPESLRFFDFTAEVREAACEQGYTRLTLPLPLELGTGQRRAFERLPTPDFTLPGFRLWFGKLLTRLASSSPAPSEPARPAPVMPFGEGSPRERAFREGALAMAMAKTAKSRLLQSLSWRPVPLGEVRVLDVSAGGAKLLLPAVVDNLWTEIKPGQLLLIQTVVPVTQTVAAKPTVDAPTMPRMFPAAFAGDADVTKNDPLRSSTESDGEASETEEACAPEGDEKQTKITYVTSMNLAIVGEVLRVTPSGPDPSVIRVAVRFRRWMRVVPESRLDWTVLRPTEGIAPLGQWIRKRINEQATPTGEPALEDKDFDLCLYGKDED